MATELHVHYFDGRSALAQPVSVRLDGGVLQVRHSEWALELPATQVQWPERDRHGRRSAVLPNGALLQSNDSQAWDYWYESSGLHSSPVVRLQQNWAGVATAMAALLLVLGALYQWGLPAIARAVVPFTPYSIDQELGLRVMQHLDNRLMQPSELPLAQREGIREAFRKASAVQGADTLPLWSVEFRKSRMGPNALALPGGTIFITDDMVKLVDGDTRALTAVFAHELGHLHHRHGIRMLVQVSVLGVIASVLWGDFSWALNTVPAWLGQADYSREVEREADAYALEFLRTAGIDPGAMVTLFEKIQVRRQIEAGKTQQTVAVEKVAAWLGIAFASHPADADRIAFFRSHSN
jgi:Zn-dependent protease with chaperone function